MRCEPLERRELLAAELLPGVRHFSDFPSAMVGPQIAGIGRFSAIADANETIVVEIRIDPSGEIQNARDALVEIGFEETAHYRDHLSGELPRAELLNAAELPMVMLIRETGLAVFNAGTVSSQADPAMRSDIARSRFGVDGTGIKIGVISDSYDRTSGGGGAAGGIASGNLPGIGNPNGRNLPVIVLQDAPTTGPTAGRGKDEGRAMLELIHDIAPGAELMFHTGITGPVQFAQAVQALRAAGADIIVDDVTYPGMQIFQDGITAQAVADATAAGVSFFSSAGNQGSESYSSPFRTDGRTNSIPNFPPAAGKLYEPHDFDPGPAVDNFQTVVLGSSRAVSFTFQWDQPSASLGGPGATSDKIGRAHV